MIEIKNPTFVSFGGVDITASVKRIAFAAGRANESMKAMGAALSECRTPIRFRSRGMLNPYGYRVFFGHTHPRISRMHAAYGKRRGRGRW